MNQDGLKNLQIGLSEVGRFLFPFVLIWFLGSLGLGWLVKSFFFLVLLLLITPFLAIAGLQWWLRRNVIQSQCPACGFEFVGLNGSNLSCPSCGEEIRAQGGQFQRSAPPGTIDVVAVEVPAGQQILDASVKTVSSDE